MGANDLHFSSGCRRWDFGRKSVHTDAITGKGLVVFYIAGEALAALIDPDPGPITPQQALAVYDMFEADVQRIAESRYRLRGDAVDVLMIRREDIRALAPIARLARGTSLSGHHSPGGVELSISG